MKALLAIAYCKALGCSRGGTSSCPTAANVHSCGTRNVSVPPSILQSHPDALMSIGPQ